jgi:two-component system, LytTR family, response regulator LytT
MNVLIVEDEAIASDNLGNMLLQIDPLIHIQAKLESVKDSINWLQNNTADLIFLDIHLSDGLSFSIFEQLDVKVPVIFTTAYDQYTMKAFKLYSIDYLLKPIEISELKKSIEKYKNLTSLNQNQNIDIKTLIESFSNIKEYQKRFVVYAGQKIKMVKTSEIAYFYGSDNGNFLCTFENQIFSIEYSLNKLENILDPEIFFRINRNFIVNIEAIKEMFTLSKSRIKIELNPKTEKETLVSFNRMSNFRKWINR